MRKVSVSRSVPDGSIAGEGFGVIHYCDTYTAPLDVPIGMDEALERIFAFPAWVSLLVKVRNAVVRLFGLKTGDRVEDGTAASRRNGSRASYPPVIARNDNEVVMGFDDKHLNFRLSVMLSKAEAQAVASLVTVVHFNNVWGRLYFVPVRPFHCLIVRSLMKRLMKSQSASRNESLN